MDVINHISSILKFSLKTVVYPLCFLNSNRIRLDHCYWACHHDKVEMLNFQSPASLPHFFCWMRHCSWAGSHNKFDLVVVWANHSTSHFSIIPRPTWKLWSTGRGRVLQLVTTALWLNWTVLHCFVCFSSCECWVKLCKWPHNAG